MKYAASWFGVVSALVFGCGDFKGTGFGAERDSGRGAAGDDAGDRASSDGGTAEDAASEADGDASENSDERDAEVITVDAGAGSGDGGSDRDCKGLTATIRDFRKGQPVDFEGPGNNTVNLGIVNNELGSDHKPVYSATAPMVSTSGAANFNQWYRDVNGVNQAFTIEIPLMQMGAGLFVYDNSMFFPIDGKGFGNEGNPHNFHFTTEIHTRFTYNGGEVFTFRGDDDVWAFVNNKLAIDLGGVHQPQTKTINFDARAAELGLTKGQTYPMDIFHAERHTVESNFRIETSISCFTPVTLF